MSALPITNRFINQSQNSNNQAQPSSNKNNIRSIKSSIPFLSNNSNPSHPSPSPSSDPSSSTDLSSAKLKISAIASKLITGVHSTTPETARDRWSSSPNSGPRPPSHRPKQASESGNNHHQKSITASAFAAAKQERAALRSPSSNPQPHNYHYHHQNHNLNHGLHSNRTSNYYSSQHYQKSPNRHQRSQSQFERAPTSEHFTKNLNSSGSPLRSQKGSAPAAIVDIPEEDDPRDLRQLLDESDRNLIRSKENEPFFQQRKIAPTSSRLEKSKLNSKDSFVALPYSNSSPFNNSNSNGNLNELNSSSKQTKNQRSNINISSEKRSVENPMRELYLSQVGGKDGKVENEKQRVDREFSKLLDEMQIAESVKVKMNGLDHPVKSAMLKSSNQHALLNMIGKQDKLILKQSTSSFQKPSLLSSPSELNVGKSNEVISKEGSAWWAMYLKSHNFRELLSSDLKKLRVALRTQPPIWTEEFIGFGGYLALMRRLKELLEIEWREEQHDDQVLFEILRCFKALLLTEPGRSALSSRLPDPFVQLTSLLYSEKKPGDLTSRQVMLELILGCFELKVEKKDWKSKIDWKAPIDLNLNKTNRKGSQLQGNGYNEDQGRYGMENERMRMGEEGESYRSYNNEYDQGCEDDELSGRRMINDDETGDDEEGDEDRLSDNHQFVKKLLFGPPDQKKENIVEFVAVTHRSRPFKALVNELIGVLMDYFWVFCHAENKFWDLKMVDEEKLEAPKVPSGMTGGVEYEAMSYCTVLMRLINELIKSSEGKEEALKIHLELFESGFERCLITLRKSSMTYYPTVHLELSRYFELGFKVSFKFPYSISRHFVVDGNHLVGCVVENGGVGDDSSDSFQSP